MKYYDKVISDAFEKSETVLATAYGSQCSDINTSDIVTKLIQLTGRYCEKWASDLLINIERMNSCIKEMDNANETEPAYIAFGIRQLGVDGNSFTAARIHENGMLASYKTISDFYRQILCVKISRKKNEFDFFETAVELRDIKNTIAYNDKYARRLEKDVTE